MGFEQGLNHFDHKNVPVVLGIYLGFAKRKDNITVIPDVSCIWKKNVITLKVDMWSGVAIENCVKKMQMEWQTV